MNKKILGVQTVGPAVIDEDEEEQLESSGTSPEF